MGIDAEDVLVCLWRCLRFFINTSYVCVQKHPFVSCTLLIGFLVYIFVDLLLYHLPFLVFVAVLLRLFWTSERQQAAGEKDRRGGEKAEHVEREANAVNAARVEASSYRRQKSRRTYFSKDKSFSPSVSHACNVENETKVAVVREEKRPNYASDEEDDEINNKRAVEWNDDDQKNLDDLGISEMERNRRLESLIAKRRARKLEEPCGAIADASPIQATSAAPILAARNVLITNPFEDDNGESNNGHEGCQVPGSAPSVLLPGKNPFDIPYDPMEEKPDLTADSFQEEFSVVNQRENLMYCRHESFCLEGFDRFESEKCRRDAKLSAFFGDDKRGFTRPPDNVRLIEHLLGGTKSHIDHTPSVAETGAQYPMQPLFSDTSLVSEASKLEGETETVNDTVVSEQDVLNDMENANSMDAVSTLTEVDTEPSTVEDSETASSSSFEVSNRSIETMTNLEPTHELAREDSTVSAIVDPQYDTSPNANDKNRVMAFFGDKLAIHTPSYSIASDLQVEVSEIGSPPLTVGNVSPNDGDSVSFDEEMEHAQLNFDVESLDDINKALERVGKLRESTGSGALASESQETTTMRLAEKLSSHPFFESVYGGSEKTAIPSEDSVEENTVEDARDSGVDSIDDAEDREKHGDGDLSISVETIDNKTMVPSEETNVGSSARVEYQTLESSHPTTGDTDLNVVRYDHEEESMKEVSKSIEAKDDVNNERRDVTDENDSAENQNSGAVIESVAEVESLVEEVLVNQSSPSSPMSTPIKRIPMDDAFSSNLDRQLQINVAKSGGFGTMQVGEQIVKESSSSEKIIGEVNAVADIVEQAIEDKAGREEPDSTERASETGYGSSEGTEKMEPSNPTSEASEKGNCIG